MRVYFYDQQGREHELNHQLNCISGRLWSHLVVDQHVATARASISDRPNPVHHFADSDGSLGVRDSAWCWFATYSTLVSRVQELVISQSITFKHSFNF